MSGEYTLHEENALVITKFQMNMITVRQRVPASCVSSTKPF